MCKSKHSSHGSNSSIQKTFQHEESELNGFSTELDNLLIDVDPHPRELWKVSRDTAYDIKQAYSKRMQKQACFIIIMDSVIPWSDQWT